MTTEDQNRLTQDDSVQARQAVLKVVIMWAQKRRPRQPQHRSLFPERLSGREPDNPNETNGYLV